MGWVTVPTRTRDSTRHHRLRLHHRVGVNLFVYGNFSTKDLMTSRRKCNCPDCSPFKWQGKPSIIAGDKTYQLRADGLTKSQASTNVIERERRAGKKTGTLYGMGNKNTQPPPVGDFHVYAKAGKNKVNFATIHKD